MCRVGDWSNSSSEWDKKTLRWVVGGGDESFPSAFICVVGEGYFQPRPIILFLDKWLNWNLNPCPQQLYVTIIWPTWGIHMGNLPKTTEANWLKAGSLYVYTHTHTHKRTYTYIYIYICFAFVGLNTAILCN